MLERAGVGGYGGVGESWGRRVWERAGIGGCGRELG